MTMNKYYLEWLFLKSILEHFLEQPDVVDTGYDTFKFGGIEYSMARIRGRYMELTMLLLEDYEL